MSRYHSEAGFSSPHHEPEPRPLGKRVVDRYSAFRHLNTNCNTGAMLARTGMSESHNCEETPSVLPPLYQRWIDAFLTVPLQPETRSSCLSCPMVTKQESPHNLDLIFTADVKCCTYVPTLPNFLTGAVLGSDEEAAKEVLRRRMRAASIMSPLGVRRTAAQATRYAQIKKENLFGQVDDYSCPHLDEGKCGIWRHRNSVCSTWFCKHTDGAMGSDLWSSVQAVLVKIETALDQWCVERAGLDFAAATRFVEAKTEPETADAAPPPGLWGELEGDEEAFFIQCAQWVDALTWPELREIVGALDDEFEAALDRLQQAQALLTPTQLPSWVRIGRFQCVGVDGRTYVRGFLRTNPFELDSSIPTQLLMFLPMHRGIMTLEDLTERVQERHGVTLTHEQLRLLLHYGVLRAAKAPSEDAAERT